MSSFKKILAIIAFSVIFPLTASAKNSLYLEEVNYFNSEKVVPQFQSYMTYGLTEYFGLSGWFLVNQNWAESVVGITFSPAKWITLGAGAGLEQADDLWRLNGSLWLGNRTMYLLGITEYGASGLWYKVETNYNLIEWFGAGLLLQRFYGLGLRLQFSIPKTPLKIYGAPLYDIEFEKFGGLVAVRFSL